MVLATTYRPNILFIVGDDWGCEQMPHQFDRYAYVGPNAITRAATPNIDLLFDAGAKLTRLYVSAFCSPTRAQYLTGRQSCRTGLGDIVESNFDNPLWDSEYTLFELIRDASGGEYDCGAFGKWHLGNSKDGNLGPRKKGLGYHAVTVRNLRSPNTQPEYDIAYYTYDAIVNGEIQTIRNRYASQWAAEEAARWIRQRGKRPWVAYVPFHTPHSPYHRPPTGTYNATTWPLATPAPPVLSSLDTLTLRPFFKASQEAQDYYIGRLLSWIDPEVLANTYIVWITDNGTSAEAVGYEPGNVDYPAANEKWLSGNPMTSAQAKRSVYDSGIRVPGVIVSPSSGLGFQMGIGKDRDQMISAVDLFPTFARWLGIDAPSRLGKRGVVLDGIDLTDDLVADTEPDREYIVSEIFDNQTVPDVQKTNLVNSNVPNKGTYQSGRMAVVSKHGLKLHRTTTNYVAAKKFYDVPEDPEESIDLLISSAVGGGTLAGLGRTVSQEVARMETFLADYYASIKPIRPPPDA
jgi:arylsulfatase A-like enzyme